MQTFDAPFLLIMAKLAVAMLLGLVLGLERVYAHKTAGMRTYALVALASAAFITVSVFIGDHFMQFAAGFNPAFIAGEIVVGVGFLGAGLIIFKDGHIENLTTAGGLWICAGIGMMCGFGMIREAIFTGVLTFFVMGVLSVVERRIRLHYFPDPVFEAALIAEKKPRKKRVVKVPVQ
ncbi:MAG: putative rane protein [Patescibacteria group bacterium]|nr:putative rane protein [Patescibacteria group bacterium]